MDNITINEKWKQSNGKYKCPYCDKEYVRAGIVTHIYRSHSNRKFSSGYNGCYHKKEYKEKIVKSNKIHHDKCRGELKEFSVKCANHKCNQEFTVIEYENYFPTKNKYFCSRKCSNSRNHSESTKNKISKSLKGNPHKEKVYGKCLHCGIEIDITYNLHKKYCSNKCSAIARRKNFDKLNIYRQQCSFNFALNDYPDEFDFSLIEQYGWYKAKNHGNNLNGISRDHIISIKYGFENNIDPTIISHPANCQLLRHNFNVSKGSHCHMTIDELKEKIKMWDKKYGV